jgi:hypothetical protein
MYWGGPYFDESSPGASMTLFTAGVNSLPSVIVCSHGNGRVLLSGVHVEFDEDSDRDGILWDNHLEDEGSEWGTVRLLFLYLLNPAHDF